MNTYFGYTLYKVSGEVEYNGHANPYPFDYYTLAATIDQAAKKMQEYFLLKRPEHCWKSFTIHSVVVDTENLDVIF